MTNASKYCQKNNLRYHIIDLSTFEANLHYAAFRDMIKITIYRKYGRLNRNVRKNLICSYLMDYLSLKKSSCYNFRPHKYDPSLYGSSKTVMHNNNEQPVIWNNKGEHNDFCEICKRGDDLILCGSCTCSYHLACISPEMTKFSGGCWNCSTCVCKESFKIAKKKWVQVEKIISWRGSENSSINPREYLVKLVQRSYRDCTWLPTADFKGKSKRKLKCYIRMKMNKHSSSNSKSKKHTSILKELLSNGVQKEWMTIKKIISHNNGMYLVKWMGLDHDQCTWENELANIPNMSIFIDKYHQNIKTIPNPGENMENAIDHHTKFWEKLHSYQVQGVNWLTYSWHNRFNTILADEMGLGKTIQTIMFLSKLMTEEGTHGPFLLAVPLSTLMNWEREFEIWAPHLYVVTYYGNKNNRKLTRQYEFYGYNNKKPNVNTGFNFHVLLTSYDDIIIDKTFLYRHDWKVLIVDEGHRLKNRNSKFFAILSQYSVQYRILLTGTPLQNNLRELFNLMNFIEPSKFEDIEEFLLEFSDIEKQEQINKLHEILSLHMLRRLKAEVHLSIPPKSEVIIKVDLTSFQRKYFQLVLDRNSRALKIRGCLNLVVDLKKLCNHPYLFHAAYEEAPKLRNGDLDVIALINSSGKLQLLSKMLKHLYAMKHRVLIFSQMTRMLDLIEIVLNYKNYKYERLDGRVISSYDRQNSIDRFNKPNAKQFIFLLSTRAGGVGINLASADTVVIYDSDWNPHNDEQALSRSHRIGQSKPVMIYRLMTRNSVEERVAQVAEDKMTLTNLIVRSMSWIGNITEECSVFEKNENSDKIIWDDEAVAKILNRDHILPTPLSVVNN